MTRRERRERCYVDKRKLPPTGATYPQDPPQLADFYEGILLNHSSSLGYQKKGYDPMVGWNFRLIPGPKSYSQKLCCALLMDHDFFI